MVANSEVIPPADELHRGDEIHAKRVLSNLACLEPVLPKTLTFKESDLLRNVLPSGFDQVYLEPVDLAP